MLKSVEFKNFKCLRDSTLPLSPCTLIVGPNGSGKTSALQGIAGILRPGHWTHVRSVGAPPDKVVLVRAHWAEADGGGSIEAGLDNGAFGPKYRDSKGEVLLDNAEAARRLNAVLRTVRVYSLQAAAIASPRKLVPRAEIAPDGRDLVVVLDRLRDNHPERWEAINEELGRWLPEFDYVLFDTPGEGDRGLQLRTRQGQHAIAAEHVSQGTLLALAILTLAYLPDPPRIIGLEEPDRGIHPRLLRDVRDAMYRLAYPESVGEKRDPVQVIATTHSPYMLDLFRDHPEEIVIAEKVEGNVQFRRLSEFPNVEEILEDSHLGDVWYSGILGGVPTDR